MAAGTCEGQEAGLEGAAAVAAGEEPAAIALAGDRREEKEAAISADEQNEDEAFAAGRKGERDGEANHHLGIRVGGTVEAGAPVRSGSASRWVQRMICSHCSSVHEEFDALEGVIL
jgi:hypothetical protein